VLTLVFILAVAFLDLFGRYRDALMVGCWMLQRGKRRLWFTTKALASKQDMQPEIAEATTSTV
jgi:hypothetical protein